MGVEYKLTCRDFDVDSYERLIEKILSAVDNAAIVHTNGDVEIRFEENPGPMPDLAIQRTENPNEFIFLYNGGYMKSWPIFGLLISYLASRSQDLIVEEL